MKLNDNRRKKILRLLDDAKKSDINLEQFGAKQHEYKLNSPIEEKKVRKIESEYEFQLPEDYFWFISQVGNGGAGPGLGLYQFGNVIDHDEFLYINGDPIIDHTLTEEEYSDFISNHYSKIKNADSKDKSRHLYLQLQQGLLLIATAGMHSDIFLVMSGKDRGRVLFSNPNKLPKLSSQKNFIDWYENWLKLIIDYYNK